MIVRTPRAQCAGLHIGCQLRSCLRTVHLCWGSLSRFNFGNADLKTGGRRYSLALEVVARLCRAAQGGSWRYRSPRRASPAIPRSAAGALECGPARRDRLLASVKNQAGQDTRIEDLGAPFARHACATVTRTLRVLPCWGRRLDTRHLSPVTALIQCAAPLHLGRAR